MYKLAINRTDVYCGCSLIRALASPAMGHWGTCPPPSTSS